jgi:hypothetical protein
MQWPFVVAPVAQHTAVSLWLTGSDSFLLVEAMPPSKAQPHPYLLSRPGKPEAYRNGLWQSRRK